MAHLCERCGYSATTKASLIRHLQSKSPCNTENDDTPREVIIEQLQKREHKIETIYCPVCNKLIGKSNLARHRKICKQHEQPKHDLNVNHICKHVLEVQENHENEIQALKKSILNFYEHKLSDDSAKASTSQQHKPHKKAKITHAMRIVCWNTYIGEEIGKSQCLCCKSNYITQHNFHCGHVVAEANGGKVHVDNLRPICAVCNNSMGTMDMKVFAFDNFNVEL